MFKNYLKVAIRNLFRHKGFSFINIAGLGIGMACTIMILLWVQNEKNYDKFHPNAPNIYRVMSYGTKFFQKGIDGTPAPLAPAIKTGFPEVKNVTRLADIPRLAFKKDSHIFFENRGLAVDPAFLDMFFFPLQEGNPESAFTNPLDIVISKEMAEKYFGKKKASNETLEIEGKLARISSVLKKIPANSHIKFDYLISFKGMQQLASWGTHWGAFNFVTYLQLHPGTDIVTTAKKITRIAAKNNCPQVKDGVHFQLQSLLDIHLDGRGSYRNYIDLIDGKYVVIFSIIAIFVLLIACFNFMNLSTARSAYRSKEVGVRKLIGAVRSQITWQFMGETFVLSAIALSVAILLIELFLPVLNRISSRELSLNFLNIGQLAGIGAITIVTGFLAGLYPAFYLSAQSTKKNISGFSGGKGSYSGFRKILVIKQFTITIILIITTMLLHKQMLFIQKKNLGFKKENIICLPLKDNIGKKYSAVKSDLLMDANIKDVTAVHYFFPLLIPRTTAYDWEGKEPNTQVDMQINAVGYDFFTTLGVKIVQGRSFSPQFSTDADQGYIVNEEALAIMGISSPIGKKFSYNRKKGTIVGVVKNVHFRPLYQKIEPHVFILRTDHSDATQYGAILIKTTRQGTEKALSTVENVWKKINPNVPFEHHFLDQVYENLYQNEKRIRTILNHFTILTLFISCLGLFGLANFITERRTKEIGIRKILGASLGQITIKLSKDFIKWIIIAFILAVPISYYIVTQMLNVYAYKTNINIWLFVFSGIIVLASALITVSYQSIKAATANPVEALRNE